LTGEEFGYGGALVFPKDAPEGSPAADHEKPHPLPRQMLNSPCDHAGNIRGRKVA